jgi:hypothetical protein
LDCAYDVEAELLVERLGRPCGDFESMCALVPSPLARVLHERTSDASPHMARVNEQAIELVGTVLTRMTTEKPTGSPSRTATRVQPWSM